MAAKSPPSSPKSGVKKTAPRKPGVRLTVDTVFKLLKKTNKEYDWLADKILDISDSKRREIAARCSNTDDRLKESIQFWMKRCPYASYRWIIFWLNYEGISDIPQEMHHLLEPIQDASLTSANITSVVALFSDEELKDVLSGVSGDSREQWITEWMMTIPMPTWEWLGGQCFCQEKEKPLQEVKKHFKRKSEPSLTVNNLCGVLAEIKDWSNDGLPYSLQIPDSKVLEMEQLYPDLSQRQSALIQLWLDSHPAPSWELVCNALYGVEEYEVLENVQNKYFKGTSETRRHLKMAMKRGKGKTSITKVVLFGSAGSGKTCTMQVILDEEPPEEYTSTPLAVRPVKVYRVDMTPSQWKKLSRKKQDLVIAKACHLYDADEIADIPQELIESNEMVEVQQCREAELMSSPKGETGAASHSSAQPTSSDTTTSKASSKSKGEVTPVIPSLATYDDLISRMEECSIDDTITEIRRVQVSDCGGQPQYHEILPVFLRGTSLYLYVFKLNEELRAYPMIKYHVDGKAICNPYQCSETYEQILEHCLRVVRSQKATDEKSKPPRIMIIGTHKDKEHECTTETREAKNKRLTDMLLPEFKKEVVYYQQRPTKALIYPMNAKNPGEEEKRSAAEIRRLVSTECTAEAVEIPLQWHALECLLEDLATGCGRDVISKAECFAAAQKLHFDDESALDAALDYLDQLNLVFYYPDILPGVVFASAQVLLDKVTELVVAAHELRDGVTSTAMSKLQDEKWQRFCDHALISAEFLAQEEFQKHYKSDLFNHNDLMLLFKKLLIFAVFSEREVFVPALLRRLKKEEIDKHRVPCSSSAASPLVLTFPKHGGPLLGVFCASVVSLLSEENTFPCPWKLAMDEDDIIPCCLYRNCVEFTVHDYPGSVVLIDSFEHIEVHVHIEASAVLIVKDFAQYCGTVQHGIIEAIRRATHALHYDYYKPTIGFGCPCDLPAFHLAKVRDDQASWICSKNRNKCNHLAENQKVWLKSDEERPKTKPSDSSCVNSTPEQHDSPCGIRPDLHSAKVGENPIHKNNEEFGTLTPEHTISLEEDRKDHEIPSLSDSTPELHQLDLHSKLKLVEHAQPVLLEEDHEDHEIPSLSDSTPEFHQLDLFERHGKKLKLIKRITAKWKRVATRLQFHHSTIEAINIDCHHKTDPACRSMFAKWLDGEGRQPITWGTLIAALREAELSSVAQELDKMVNGTSESESPSEEPRHRSKNCQLL